MMLKRVIVTNSTHIVSTVVIFAFILSAIFLLLENSIKYSLYIFCDIFDWIPVFDT